MGNFIKWLGAGLGFAVGGPIGSILGFVVGNFIEGFTAGDVERAKAYATSSRNSQSGDFEISLLLLSAVVIKADGAVIEEEVNAIKTIASYLYISQHDFESIKAMFYDSSESAYKILEIEKSASNDELKKAYRKMVKKYHPDKLQHLGEEHVKGAEDKFKQVQKAYEQIQKERGL